MSVFIITCIFELVAIYSRRSSVFFINRPQTKTEHNIFVDSVCVTNACMCYQAYRQHSLLNATVVVAANCHKQCTLVLPDSSCHGDDDQHSAHSTHARAHKANDKLLLLFTAVYLTVCIKTKICVLHTTTRTLSIADAHTVKQSKTTQFWQNGHYHGIIHCKLFFFLAYILAMSLWSEICLLMMFVIECL